MNKILLSVVWVLIGLIGGWAVNEIIYLFLNRPPIGVNLMAAILPATGQIFLLVFCITKAILILKGQTPRPIVSEKYKKQLLIVIAIYFGLIVVTKIYNGTNHQGQSSAYSPPSTNSSTQSNSKSAEVPIVTQPKRQLCYVYWDGNQFQIGKTEGNQFSRFSWERYGVELIEVGLPIETVRALGLSNMKTGDDINKKEFNAFMNKYFYQIKNLCHIQD